MPSDLSLPPRYAIGKVRISATNLDETADILLAQAERGEPGYVCVTNVRTAHLANKDSGYCAIQNGSLMAVPDGMPLVWYARRKGFAKVGRVCGPDLMEAVLRGSAEKGHSHYFYGSAEPTLAGMSRRLAERFPGLDVLGLAAPPFQPLEAFDLDALAADINALKPAFFWVGLGAPKQERLMALLQPKLTHTISIGVGLAFDYFAGNVSRPPLWVQRTGLEWAFRLAQQPAKVVRFWRPAFWFLSFLVIDQLRKPKPT